MASLLFIKLNSPKQIRAYIILYVKSRLASIHWSQIITPLAESLEAEVERYQEMRHVYERQKGEISRLNEKLAVTEKIIEALCRITKVDKMAKGKTRNKRLNGLTENESERNKEG